MILEDDLAQVDTDIATARLEAARVAARIEGLLAQRAALAASLERAATSLDTAPRGLATAVKSDAIVSVLEHAPQPLRIAQIVGAMQRAGRSGENYNGVSVYLDTLLKQHRVQRVGRGLYTAGVAR